MTRLQKLTFDRVLSKLKDTTNPSIDAGIIDVVAALNAIGLTTVASCEGHLNHGEAYPWITILTANKQDMESKYLRLIEILYTYYNEYPTRYFQLIKIMQKDNTIEISSLIDLNLIHFETTGPKLNMLGYLQIDMRYLGEFITSYIPETDVEIELDKEIEE